MASSATSRRLAWAVVAVMAGGLLALWAVRSVSSAPPPDVRSLRACPLLQRAEVVEITGLLVVDANSSPPGAPPDPGPVAPSCQWIASDGEVGLAVAALASDDAPRAFATMKERLGRHRPVKVPVGDEAFAVPVGTQTQVVARRGGRIVVIGARAGPDSRRIAERAASVAVDRLEQLS